jgi:hypothetical protein
MIGDRGWLFLICCGGMPAAVALLMAGYFG